MGLSVSPFMMNWRLHLLFSFYYLEVFAYLWVLLPYNFGSPWPLRNQINLLVLPVHFLHHTPNSSHLSGAMLKILIVWPPSLEILFSWAELRNPYLSNHPKLFLWPSNWGCACPQSLPFHMWKSQSGITSDWQKIWITPRSKEGQSHCVRLFQLVPLPGDLWQKVTAVFFLIKSLYIQMSFHPEPAYLCLRVVLFLKLQYWLLFFFFGWEAIRLCLLKKWRGMFPILFNWDDLICKQQKNEASDARLCRIEG